MMNNKIPYPTVAVRIRDDLAAGHQDVLDHIARPGTWWTGHQRLGIATEARHAKECPFCQKRRQALSPNAVSGQHDCLGGLPEPIVEIIHRIVTDPARLSRSWYQEMLRCGVTEDEYIETLSVIVHTVSLDTFAKAIGIAELPLLPPHDGVPSRCGPSGVTQGAAWVPWIETAEQLPANMSDLYPPGRPPANIMRAMSLVPAEVRCFFELGAVQYLGPAQMRDFSQEFRAITHAQIELVAGRISSLNQCLY